MPLQQRSAASQAALAKAQPKGWGRWFFPLLCSGETYLGCWVQLWTLHYKRETEKLVLWKCLRRGDWGTGCMTRGWVSSARRREVSERSYCCLQVPKRSWTKYCKPLLQAIFWRPVKPWIVVTVQSWQLPCLKFLDKIHSISMHVHRTGIQQRFIGLGRGEKN